MDSLNKLTQTDYLQMLDRLGINPGEKRPGVSGNPKDSNAASRFEEKVNQYKLPDPLVLKNGKKLQQRINGGKNAALYRHCFR